MATPTALRGAAARAPASPLKLDTWHVQNWQPSASAAILNPQADTAAQLAWCWGQVHEMHDLLHGYVCIPEDAGRESMADQLCIFIEARMAPLLAMLERLCDQAPWEGQP